jgi:hypothetical protein
MKLVIPGAAKRLSALRDEPRNDNEYDSHLETLL